MEEIQSRENGRFQSSPQPPSGYNPVRELARAASRAGRPHTNRKRSPDNPAKYLSITGAAHEVTRKRPVEVISLLDSDDESTPAEKKSKAHETPIYQANSSATTPWRPFPEGLSTAQYVTISSLPSQPGNEVPTVNWVQGHRGDPVTVPGTMHEKQRQEEIKGQTKDGPTADIVPITEPELCKEQADLVDIIMSGRNVFYTGSAGCGKSTVLKAFVKRFRQMDRKVNIIAPTGRAALDINGSTTWTYAGWTPDHHKRELDALRRAAHGKFVNRRLKETDVLVLDEVSMVENLHFERLNVLMKEARSSDRAFGGVQLIVTGDFCQLPPVKPFGHCIDCGRELISNAARTEYKCRQCHRTYYDIDKWAFRSTAWKECDFAHVNLTNIHRQSDQVFIKILQKCRMGQALTPTDTNLLLSHHSETRNAVKLFATREEVKRVNVEAFNRLRSKARGYQGLDYFWWNEKHGHLQSKGDRGVDGSLLALRDHRFDTRIQLKKGMLVVLLVNLDIAAGLVNGSQGVIQGFEKYDPKKLPQSTESQNGKRRRKDDEDMMASGGVVPTLTGDHAALREEQIKNFISNAENKEWPIVTFMNSVTRTIYADCTVNEIGDEKPYSLLSRTQIPLMAAWAMSIHKSQGMTLNRVVVDLSKSFEEGQMYVALSRARSLEGLKVEGLGRGLSSGNAQVREFLLEKFGIRT